MSAPSASGCWPSGVANVLSTTMRVPGLRGAAQIAATSATSSRGLDGDSIHSRSASARLATHAPCRRRDTLDAPAVVARAGLGDAGDALVAVVAHHEMRPGGQLAQHSGAGRHAGGERTAWPPSESADELLECLPGLVASLRL